MSHKLNDPIVIYTAATNTDAQLIAGLLTATGIDAFAVDDMSPGGMYSLGTLSELHRPQVFVDKSRADDAAKFLDEYETRSESADTNRYCYHCGMLCSEDGLKCSECGATLEWENTETSEQVANNDDRDLSDPNAMSLVRKLKKPIAFVILVPALIWFAGVAFGVIRMFLTPFLE